MDIEHKSQATPVPALFRACLLQPEFLAHKEVTEEELKDYPFWATKASDCRNSVGEWLRWLGDGRKERDDVISHRVH